MPPALSVEVIVAVTLVLDQVVDGDAEKAEVGALVSEEGTSAPEKSLI